MIPYFQGNGKGGPAWPSRLKDKFYPALSPLPKVDGDDGPSCAETFKKAFPCSRKIRFCAGSNRRKTRSNSAFTKVGAVKLKITYTMIFN